jgi:hypothetical protein
MPNRSPIIGAYVAPSWQMTAEAQREFINKALPDFGPPDYVHFEDGYHSNKRLIERNEGRKLDQLLQAGDHLVVTHFDHLGRNDLDSLQTIEQFADRGVIVHVLKIFGYRFDVDTPQDRVVLKILIGIAKGPRDKVSRRTKEIYAHLLATRGYVQLYPAFGERVEVVNGKRRIVPWPYEQRWANQCWHWRHNEGWSWAEIEDELKRRRVKGPKGCRWGKKRISKAIMRSEMPFPWQPLAVPSAPLPAATSDSAA